MQSYSLSWQPVRKKIVAYFLHPSTALSYPLYSNVVGNAPALRLKLLAATSWLWNKKISAMFLFHNHDFAASCFTQIAGAFPQDIIVLLYLANIRLLAYLDIKKSAT